MDRHAPLRLNKAVNTDAQGRPVAARPSPHGRGTHVRPQHMQRPRTEARFAVGSRAGARSTIWKAWVQGDEAYLTSRMFGSDVKASFHSTGHCQWSCTDTWVMQQPNVRNSERHIVRWTVDQPATDEALLIFQVEIPVSELRDGTPPTDKKKVFWVSGAPPESTVRFLAYLTRPSETDPAPSESGSMRHLFSLRLRNARWLVVFFELISLSVHDIAEARRAVQDQAVAAGFSPAPEHRASLFIQPHSEGGARGLLELCLTEA